MDSLHRIDMEFILESLKKINNQTFDSGHRWKMILALIGDIENLLERDHSTRSTERLKRNTNG